MNSHHHQTITLPRTCQFDEQGHDDTDLSSSEIATILGNSISEAVSMGAFTEELQSVAASIGVPSLQEALVDEIPTIIYIDNAPPTSIPTSFPSDSVSYVSSSTSSIDLGVYAAISISTVLILGGVMFFIHRMKATGVKSTEILVSPHATKFSKDVKPAAVLVEPEIELSSSVSLQGTKINDAEVRADQDSLSQVNELSAQALSKSDSELQVFKEQTNDDASPTKTPNKSPEKVKRRLRSLRKVYYVTLVQAR